MQSTSHAGTWDYGTGGKCQHFSLSPFILCVASSEKFSLDKIFDRDLCIRAFFPKNCLIYIMVACSRLAQYDAAKRREGRRYIRVFCKGGGDMTCNSAFSKGEGSMAARASSMLQE